MVVVQLGCTAVVRVCGLVLSEREERDCIERQQVGVRSWIFSNVSIGGPGKVRKYVEVSTSQHASFIPFAAESTGGMSTGAIELLKQITLASNDHLRLDPAQARVGAMQAAEAICLFVTLYSTGGGFQRQ